MANEKFEKLSLILEKGWGMQLKDYASVEGVYKVVTEQGTMSLKKTRTKSQKLDFIKCGQDYLRKNDFRNMAPILLTQEGLPYYKENKDNYILTPWVEGLQPSYNSINHIQMIAYTLADLHNKSKGFQFLSEKIKPQYNKWPKKISKRQRELKLYKELAHTGNHKFDSLFIEHVDWLLKRTEKSLEVLNSATYSQVVESCRVGYLCHGDTAIGNCLIRDSEAVFIDFDSMSQDLPVVDLWRLLRRALRRNQWSGEFVNAIIVAYEYNRKLSNQEKEILLALLIFPERAWRLANRYYEKKNKSLWSAEMLYKDLENFLADRKEMDSFTLQFS